MTEDELSSIAQQLVGKLRDEDPEAVNRWLSSVMPCSTDWYRLCFVLAAAVPDDKRWSELTAWTEAPQVAPERLDMIAVERACFGEPVELNMAERRVAIDRLVRLGLTQGEVASRLGLTRRTVNRHAVALRRAA